MIAGAIGDLKGAIQTYQDALDSLPKRKSDEADLVVVKALAARDAIGHAMADTPAIDPELLCQISTLDHRLKSSAAAIRDVVGASRLGEWRDAVDAQPASWWWRLDEIASAAEEKRSALWTIVAGLLITVSISLSTDISRRFLSVGPDAVGTFSTISQALLTLVAGSAFATFGRQAIQRQLTNWGVKPQHQHWWRLGLALGLLAVVFAIRLSLPLIARSYHDQGLQLQQEGKVTSSIEAYQRAISLDPDYSEAHYDLGVAYEDLLEYDKALGEYRTAIRANGQSYPAYNNLSHLYIARKGEFAGALGLLDSALALMPAKPSTEIERYARYSILKNHGWASFGLRDYDTAAADLRKALEMREDGAAAHCLLAQVLEAQQKAVVPVEEWEGCLRYEKADSVEIEWLVLARQRLTSGRGQQ